MEKQRMFEIRTQYPNFAIKLTMENVDDIMVTALEGGITDWCAKAEVVEEQRCSPWGHEQIARGGALILHEIDGEETENDAGLKLNLEKFLSGFKTWYEQALDEYAAVQMDGTVDPSDIDAIGADQIIQLAVFGDVVYD